MKSSPTVQLDRQIQLPLPRASPELSIVVPTFNESQNLSSLVAVVDKAMGPSSWELIFVDDDSPDGTWKLAKEMARTDPRIRCIRRVGRRGLAGACIDGILSSAAPYVAVIDADLQHDEAILPAMLETLERDEADIAIGSRFVGGGESGTGFSAKRAFASHVATSLAALVLGRNVSDPMSGFFVMRRDAFEAIAPRLLSSGFKLLLDVLISTPKQTRIVEVGYRFRSRQQGESKFDLRAVLDFLGLLIYRLTGGLIPVRFLLFAVAGLLGVVVHLVVLRVGMMSNLPFDWAQALATMVAMTSNFVVNNLVTYSDMKLYGASAIYGLLKFYAVCGVGAVANIGVASWLFEAPSEWWVAGMAGVAVGAVFNYTMSSIFVWRRNTA